MRASCQQCLRPLHRLPARTLCTGNRTPSLAPVRAFFFFLVIFLQKIKGALSAHDMLVPF